MLLESTIVSDLFLYRVLAWFRQGAFRYRVRIAKLFCRAFRDARKASWPSGFSVRRAPWFRRRRPSALLLDERWLLNGENTFSTFRTERSVFSAPAYGKPPRDEAPAGVCDVFEVCSTIPLKFRCVRLFALHRKKKPRFPEWVSHFRFCGKVFQERFQLAVEYRKLFATLFCVLHFLSRNC